MRAWILLVATAMPLQAQTCELKAATPVACLTVDFVQALATMARVEESGKAEAQLSQDPTEGAFYTVKSRMNAETRLRGGFARYRSSGDRRVTKAAKYAEDVFRILYAWDSAAEVNLRRAATFKSSLGEMQELAAEQKVHGDQTLDLLFATAGEILDADLIIEGPSTPITKRRMTLGQRDEIVAEIDRAFAGHLALEPDGLWYSGWAATAASIRSSLLDKGWKYSQ